MNAIQQAIEEKRLRFFNNGSYSYKPSRKYEEMKQKSVFIKKETTQNVLRECVSKLSTLGNAFEIAKKQGKVVSHVFNGKIILV